ncbi:prepilin-type N-terminal cleavage/methylation domain-containing protein [Lachnospiraceae bacterium 62-35]
MKNKNKGMTLLELIIAVAIIAILSGIAIVNLIPHLEKSREYRRNAEAQAVYRALELCFAETVTADNLNKAYVEILMTPLNSPKNRLVPYLTGKCSDGARIVSMILDKENIQITAIIYQVDGYRIEVRNGMICEE